jgi:hypothetical protein
LRSATSPAKRVRGTSSACKTIVNETDSEILVFVYGAPAERAGADVIESAV